MLTNYHHKILNEPDRNYSFYRDKIGISLAIFFFVVALFFTVFPFSSVDRNIYGQSLGEGGYCFTKFAVLPVSRNIYNFNFFFFYKINFFSKFDSL